MTSAPSPGGPSWQHEPAASHQAEPPASSSFFRWIRGLDITRTPDRWVGGVAGGVARRTGLDLALVRGLIVVLAVFGGIGVLLYGLAWALLPEPDGRIHVEQAGRGSWTSGLTGAAVLVAIGLWRPDVSAHDGGAGGLLWTLFWIGAVVLFVYWIVNRSGRGGSRPGSPYPGPTGGGPGQPQPFGPMPYGPAESPVTPAPGSSSGPSGPGYGQSGATGASAFSGEHATGSDPGDVDGDPAQGSPEAPAKHSPEPFQQSSSENDTESYPRPYTQTYPLPYQPAPWAAGSGYPEADAAWSKGPGGPENLPPAIRNHRADRIRPSGSVTALLLGGATITAAVLLVLDYTRILDVANAAAVALAAAAIVLALGIVGLGVRGRSSGLVGVTAALATIGALIASLTIVGGSWVVAQETRTTPASLQVASDGYSVMASQATIDLAGLPSPAQDVVVPVNSLASDVTVIVPEDVPVEVRTRMALANADALGTTADPDTLSPAFRGDGGVLQLGRGQLNPDATGAALILDVRGALSNLTILTATDTDTGIDGTFPPQSTGTTRTGDTP
jgi:phage shock protein PspC (stress-responsive transcriptional regulator)